MAYYVSAASKRPELPGDLALGLLMKEYGIEGNPELAMIKIISRASLYAVFRSARAAMSRKHRMMKARPIARTDHQYQINAFTLDSPDLSAVGVTVNPTLAMANHSCNPNAVVVFPNGNGLGQMMAIRSIAAGEEVSRSRRFIRGARDDG